MRNFKNVLAVALFLMGTTLFAQTKLTGKVVDEYNQALPGADVIIKGTTQGTSTDFDGNFSLETSDTAGTLTVGFMGYISKTLTFNGSQNFGTLKLAPSAESLAEVVIVGIADIAKERETPVAVSTIKASEIVERLGSQELPELLNSTPSVYATKQGGGYGDARINIRGFDQRNTAVMINGMPVNDMENGWVYWSNWAGLSDVTTAMQVQRGLGSSKLAISSVGGTINVLTKTSDARKGGSFAATYGNDNFLKIMGSYSTGKLDSGLSASVLLSQFQGDGYAYGTQFQGNTYFIGLGYEINDKHSVMFTATGAPQWHHQRSYANPISNYIKYNDVNGEPDIKYNSDWGYLNGEEYSFRRNFYHKPVSSINWDWKFNDASNLSTVVYASWGRGGGTGEIGRINGTRQYALPTTNDGLIRVDDIYAWNSGQTVPDFANPAYNQPESRTLFNGSYMNTGSNGHPDGEGKYGSDNGISRRASMNSHDWYGIISNFHHDVNDNFGYDFGVDLRTFKGIHYRIMNDDLGADGYIDYSDSNNPDRNITEYYEADPSWNPFIDITGQEKIEYYNEGGANWLGAFGQLEYKNDMVSAFMQFGASRQGFQRIDYFNLGEYNDTEQTSDWENLWGANVKGGVNLNLSERHNVFVNGGYYSKQPLFDGVYTSYNDNRVNEFLTNETIIGFELGYGYRSERASFNLNVYRTSWADRFLSIGQSFDVNNTPDDSYDDERGTANINGIKQLHMGVEADVKYRALENLRFKAMASLGSWEYGSNASGKAFDSEDNYLGDINLFLDGVKVGDAAQFTSRLGLEWDIFKNFRFDIDQMFADKLYANIDAEDFGYEGHDGSLRLPAYSLTNAGISYKFTFDDNMKLNLRVNVNNLADQIYISESDTNYHADSSSVTWNGIDTDNRVFFGFGRTWNVSARFSF